MSEAWTCSPIGDVRTVEGDKFVACVFGHAQQKIDRANLIAAAPNLLQAAEEAVGELVALDAESGNTEPWPIVQALQAAIHKAKGGQ